MIPADLYLNKIDFLKYLPGTDCKDCGEASCNIFAKALKSGTQTPEKCPFLQDSQILAFQLALNGDRILPQVPALDLPRPATTGLTQINSADEDSLVFLSGNSEFTQEVITTMMGFTLSPFWLLFVDCRGDTVDMAMVYQSLKVEKIITTLEESGLHQGQKRRKIILPGFASRLKEPVEQQTGCQVRVGPLCIAELPLFLGDDWEIPPDIDLG